MANWTMAFTNRTDGVTMLADGSINMKPVTEAGVNINTAFTTGYCCFTSDKKFTVNNNVFTVQNDDDGFESDGGATITITPWSPNNAQMSDIKKLPGIKKYKYFFNAKMSNRTANHVIVTFNPDITVDQPTPPPQPPKTYNLLDSVPAGYDVKGEHRYVDGNITFNDIDVSRLTYKKGDTLPAFNLVIKDGYEYDEVLWAEKWENGPNPVLASADNSSYFNTGYPHQEPEPNPPLWIEFHATNYTMPDELVTFRNIPEPTVAVPHYTVQLDLLNFSLYLFFGSIFHSFCTKSRTIYSLLL